MSFLRIHAQPGRTSVWTLSWFLFAAGIVLYFYVAQERHRENPDDRVMPTIGQMVRGIRGRRAETGGGGGSASRKWIVLGGAIREQHAVERYRGDRPAFPDQRGAAVSGRAAGPAHGDVSL